MPSREASSGAPPTLGFESSLGRRLILSLLLALATIALYNPITHAPFLNLDDGAYVTENHHVRAGMTWSTVIWAFQSAEATNWHPITWLSHALDCQVFGLNPAGPHTINVLIHAANAVLLYLILEAATGFCWPSFLVAALFALHPINVESVAWIAERKNVLSMFFFLVALAAYGWYVRRPGALRYVGVTIAYAFALMTKPQVITFPFALLLLDYWPLERFPQPASIDEAKPDTDAFPGKASLRALVIEKIPWFAMSVASAVITLKVQTDATQDRLPLFVRSSNAVLAYVQYLGKAFWPRNLAPVYPYPDSIHKLGVALAALAIVSLSALAITLRRRPLFVGWFWFIGTLVPMIGLVQVGVQSMADRYAYIPLVGIFVIICWGGAEILENSRISNTAAAIGAGTALLLLSATLHRQLDFWTDNLTLWSHTLSVTQKNYAAEDNMAGALLALGRVEEAVPHLIRARALRPDDPRATFNLATYEQTRGNYQAALAGYAEIPQFTTSRELRTLARLNSGYAHYSLRQYELARDDFAAVITDEPDNSSAYRGLGLLAQKAGNLSQAVDSYERSIELQPSPVGYVLLAQALEKTGQTEVALQARDRAARMTTNLDDDVDVARQLLSE